MIQQALKYSMPSSKDKNQNKVLLFIPNFLEKLIFNLLTELDFLSFIMLPLEAFIRSI